MTTATIPLLVSPEAEAFLDEYGLREPFDCIIEHARQVVPGLYQIEARVEPPYDTGGNDIILIRGFRHVSSNEGDDPTNRNLGFWRVTNFPPEVFEKIVIYTFEYEEPAHAG